MNKKTKNRIYKIYVSIMIFGLIFCWGFGAFAADDPLTAMNNLSTFIFALVRAFGIILLCWGIVQFGISVKSHDASQRANGMLTIVGGIIIVCAKPILDLITK